MDIRPVSQWLEIFRRLPSPTPEAIADRIIGDMVAYPHKSRHRERDARELAAALTALIDFSSRESYERDTMKRAVFYFDLDVTCYLDDGTVMRFPHYPMRMEASTHDSAVRGLVLLLAESLIAGPGRLLLDAPLDWVEINEVRDLVDPHVPPLR